MISILYTKTESTYKRLGQDCYDINRNARSYRGLNSIIAHPPCRAWGNYRHKAKPRQNEKELAIHAILMVRLHGGIMEHPKTSTIWKTMKLPKPGETDQYGGWTLNVDQLWFGHRAIKNTLLYIVGIKPKEIPIYPITFEHHKKTVEKMCRQKRESTPEKFAIWLILIADLCYKKFSGQATLNTWT